MGILPKFEEKKRKRIQLKKLETKIHRTAHKIVNTTSSLNRRFLLPNNLI